LFPGTKWAEQNGGAKIGEPPKIGAKTFLASKPSSPYNERTNKKLLKNNLLI
jgi:hypothetical protein